MHRRRILYVPAKNPKPPPHLHRQPIWRCLLHGVAQACPDAAREMTAQPDTFVLVSWNHLYYQRYKDISVDLPWIDRLLQRTGPSEDDKAWPSNWRLRLAWFIYNLIDLYPSLFTLVPDPDVRSAIQETPRYFENKHGIATQVREMLKAPLREALQSGERVLVIGHSMGSIIAYDTLWELSNVEQNVDPIDLFLSLGSPLGLRYVRRRLCGAHEKEVQRYPRNIRRWFNIAAEGDLTALDATLADDFNDMIELGLTKQIQDRCKGVINYFRNQEGLNVHRSYGYLVNPVVGQVIAEWWACGVP